MTQADLDKVLELHKKWLNDEEGGERANLRYANLRDANLRGANLSYANLSDADLSYANLRGANLDYSCWPICCKGKNVKIDKKIYCQLLDIIASLEVIDEDEETIKAHNAIVPLANQFERVVSGKLKKHKEKLPKGGDKDEL